jgi:hypothetical protein
VKRSKRIAPGARRKISLYALTVLAVGVTSLLFFYQEILSAAGGYLAPSTALSKAEAVIIEGNEMVKKRAVEIGLEIVASGKARRVVVVFHRSEEEEYFGKPADYGLFMREKLEELGINKDQIQVMEVPQDHPITFNEAKIVLENLSNEGVRSAILLGEDFHTRRSYWVYKQLGSPLGIEIIPCPYFLKFNSQNWWQEAKGLRNFFAESVKFFYYLFRGYIPIRSLIMT